MTRLRPLLVLLTALAAGPALAQAAPPDTTRAPVEYLDVEHPALRAALDYAVGFGRGWLADNETMAPFGVAVTAPGVPNVLAVHDPGMDSQEQLMVLVQMLRQASAEGMPSEDGAGRPVTAVALAFDILTDVPGRPGKTDALCVILEAPDAEPRAYILPYVRKKGRATFLAPYLRPQPPMLLAP